MSTPRSPGLHRARTRRMPLLVASLLAQAAANASAQGTASTASELERVSVTGDRPSTLPLSIPTTLESITGAKIERAINASDAEDALKYLPSLSVRKRYIGDYDHAVLATRASGTGNSARSLVYADGILLSNLLGNGAGFTPRWALVTPEEIERVDVLYGPFSAAYSGNSAGAIVDYVTRMPQALESHVKLQAFTQPYRLYRTDDRYSGGEGSASLGSRSGDFAWWVDVNRLSSDAQPIGFVVKNVPAATSSAGVAVTGAVAERNPRNVAGVVLGTTGQTHTTQDHAKLKLAWDVAPRLRASYTLGGWHNDADRQVDSFLRDAGGATVGSGGVARTVNMDGRAYSILPTDFAATTTTMTHVMHGLDLKSRSGGTWDGEATASRYDYVKDVVRSQMPSAAAASGGAAAGRIADQHGTGWTTLAAKGVWRDEGGAGDHVAEFGAQRDAFRLRTEVSDTPEWRDGEATGRVSAFGGDTTLTSLWAQDAWRFAPAWRAVLGLRLERWRADHGTLSTATATQAFATRRENDVSPKAAVAWQAAEAWVVKASLGRAVRYPTVSELFQGTIVAGDIVNNDPRLRAEKSWTGELGAERDLGGGSRVRGTLFAERTRDALYSQVDVAAGGTVATIQNVGRIRTSGVEVALQAADLLLRGLSLDASLTYADSRIARNDRFPASVGHTQPRVPRWRASVLAVYAPSEAWSASLGFRYAGHQYGQLDNSDSNGHAYTGFSRYRVADVRLQVRLAPSWRIAAGIDNVNNERYWAFHPYPQRTYTAELRHDL